MVLIDKRGRGGRGKKMEVELGPEEKGKQLPAFPTLQVLGSLDRCVRISLSLRTNLITVCPFCDHNNQDDFRKFGYTTREDYPCAKCKSLFKITRDAYHHVRVSFSSKDDTNATRLNEVCPIAWMVVPNTSCLYLYNYSKFREKVYVGCV